MKRTLMQMSFAIGLVTGVANAAAGRVDEIPATRCTVDAVAAGTVCLDKYEASVWRVPNPTTTNVVLVRKIRLGMAKEVDLTMGGATQLGKTRDDYAPCTHNGQNCANDIYAVSLPSEIPSAFITWFQAQEACVNSGKRLPTNAEWQVGADGTPDPGPDNGTTDCNTVAEEGTAIFTGARSSCRSARGAYDMVGNLAEWVAAWMPATTFCPGWGSFSNDQMCLAGASTMSNSPGTFVRGGQFFSGPEAGPLTIVEFPPFRSSIFVGFRCAR
jgi:formylglycine-generating enzyme required for sulfatase activity